ncbi:MAG: efflux RND transporter permease subunit [Butyricimonas paravirosa]
MRSWRTTLIPVLAIPVSLIASFFIMYVAGFTINILTLLAVVLAIGLVVDDAIVVMENIFTKIEQGMSRCRRDSRDQTRYFCRYRDNSGVGSRVLPDRFLGRNHGAFVP